MFSQYYNIAINYLFRLISQWNHLIQETSIPELDFLVSTLKKLYISLSKSVDTLSDDELQNFRERGVFFQVILSEHLKEFYNTPSLEVFKIMNDEDHNIWKRIIAKDFEKFYIARKLTETTIDDM